MFAAWLRNILTRPGLSQRGLARHLGLEPSQVSRMVQGKRRPQIDEIEKIAAYVGEYPPQLQSRSVVSTTEVVVRGIVMEHAWQEVAVIQGRATAPAPERVPGVLHPEYPIALQYAYEIVDPTVRAIGRQYIVAVPIEDVERAPQVNDWLHLHKISGTLRLDSIRRVVRGASGQLDTVDDKGTVEPLKDWTVSGLILGRTTLY